MPFTNAAGFCQVYLVYKALKCHDRQAKVIDAHTNYIKFRAGKPNDDHAFLDVLWKGSVAYPAQDDDTPAIQALNVKLHGDLRIDLALLPLADGLTLARKR